MVKKINLSTSQMGKLNKKAKLYQHETEWLINIGIEIVANLAPEVFTKIHSQATRLDLDMWQVIENYIVDRWAAEAAEIEVAKGVALLPQFTRKQNDDLVIGEELFNLLKDIYVKRFNDYIVSQEIKTKTKAEIQKEKQELKELQKKYGIPEH